MPEKADGFSAIRRSNGEDDRLGHFHNLTQFLLVISIVRRILGAEQSGRDPERFHFFPDPYQLLLFCPEYIVRVFHRGGPLTRIQDLFRLLKPTLSHLRAQRNLPEVHTVRDSPIGTRGLVGRGLITPQLMTEVIGMIFQYGKGSIKLLQKHHPGQFVRQCHPAQREHQTGLPARIFTEPIRSPDCEQ